MVVPGSDIEKAVEYAAWGEGSIEISPRFGEDQKRVQYQKLLDRVDSPQRVMDLMFRLEDENPFFQLCEDQAIADYFAKWNVPITNRRDLDLFSEVLAEKVEALVPNDKALQLLLEKRDYRKQLLELPTALSKLEEAIADYDQLKPAFKAVMQYVWEAVTLHGFKMNEDGSKATEKYQGTISIQPCPYKAVYLNIILNEKSQFDLYLNPKYKTKVIQPAKKRRFRKDVEEIVQKTDEVEEIEVIPLHQFDMKYPKNVDARYVNETLVRNPAEYCISIGKIDDEIVKSVITSLFDEFKEEYIKNPDKYGDQFKTYLQIILNLPKLMNNYTQRIREDVRKTLQEVTE